MMTSKPKYLLPLATGTGSSIVVDRCQVCGHRDLETIVFLGYLPPVNTMHPLGQRPHEQSSYPAEFVRCSQCKLVQLGLVVDPMILFPPEYPYTSGTTRILREDFADLYGECRQLIHLEQDDLVVDIGSNDGSLLSNFAKSHRVQGIEPANVGNLAIDKGIPTLISFFGQDVVRQIVEQRGKARIVTATNAFAHIEDVHSTTQAIIELLEPGGVFISESHYLLSLIERLQYDTIYHEHLRYYSLGSLKYLLELNNLEVFHARRIPTHGGSIRVHAASPGDYDVQASIDELLALEEDAGLLDERLGRFKHDVVESKLKLQELLHRIKGMGNRIYGIGAPSRASTLINYVGLDDGIVDLVLEVKGSYKTGRYMPGTLIPVVDEAILFRDQPEYALLLSWHIADELMPKLTAKGFKGEFIVPLPTPRIVAG
ncbi:MAG: class I SAM-dependent methyltransferase [Anaerolineales bacterium]